MRGYVRHWASDGFFLALVGVVAYVIKRYYRDASAEDLRWILSPTVAAVQSVSGSRFHFESGAGFLSLSDLFLIAPACAGLNFFLAVFLTGCLGFFRYHPKAGARVAVGLVSLAAAYVATLFANTVRITLSLWLRAGPGLVAHLGLSAADAHRLLGIGVYATALLATFAAAERCHGGRRDAART